MKDIAIRDSRLAISPGAELIAKDIALICDSRPASGLGISRILNIVHGGNCELGILRGVYAGRRGDHEIRGILYHVWHVATRMNDEMNRDIASGVNCEGKHGRVN